MTLRQLAALLDRLEIRQQREALHVGILAAAVANYSMVRPEKKWFVPADFIGGLPKAKPQRQTTDEMLATIQFIHNQRPENRGAAN